MAAGAAGRCVRGVGATLSRGSAVLWLLVDGMRGQEQVKKKKKKISAVLGNM